MNGSFSFGLHDRVQADPNQLPVPDAMLDPSTGLALNAMASDPSPQAMPFGQAMQTVAPPEQVPQTTAYTLPGIFASGGRVTREVYESLSPVEQNFLDTLKTSAEAGKPIKGGRQLIAAFQTYSKQVQASTPQTYKLPDGRQVTMLNGQIIPDQKQPDPVKMEIKETADGLRAIDPLTGGSFQVYDNFSGAAVTAKPKLSDSQKMRATSAQNTIDMNVSRVNQLQSLPDDAKVSWNAGTMEYEPAKYYGSLVSKERERLAKDTELQESKLNNILNPSGNAPAKSSPTPKATPAPTPDQFVVGKRYRDAKGNTAIYKGNGVFQ